MIINYMLVAIRNIGKHRLFSFITVTGLAIGMVAFVLLFKYTSFEKSYDRFHTRAHDIFRIRHDVYKQNTRESTSAITYYGAGPDIAEKFPEVLNFLRLHRADGMYNHYKSDGTISSYYEKHAFYTDTSFFSFFDFTLIRGSRTNALRKSNSMLLSESAAKKYFGGDDPIGKTITVSTEWQGGEYVVEGVFQDLPQNTHLQFDFLFPIEKLLGNEQFKYGSWYWCNFYTYLLVRPGTNATALQGKIQEVIDAHLGRELKKNNAREEFILQPLQTIHLQSNIGSEIKGPGNLQMINFLTIMSFVILVTAWLNYINLSTAKATERSREVGIRKVLGSHRAQLMTQFLFEAALLTAISLFAAIAFLVLGNSLFDGVTGQAIPLAYLFGSHVWIILAGTLIAGSFAAGVYPAFVLSSFQPIATLKGKFVYRGGVTLRKSLIVLQFTVSIILIIGTAMIFRQLQFMRSIDLGIAIDQKFVINSPKVIQQESYQGIIGSFKNELMKETGVQRVATSSEVPGREIFWTTEIFVTEQQDSRKRLFNVLAIDEDYLPEFELKLLAGRNFSSERIADFGQTAVINQSGMKLLGFTTAEQALGKNITASDQRMYEIIGVIADFHQQSMQHQVKPMLLLYIPWVRDYLTITLPSENHRESINKVNALYQKFFPGNAIEYFFLDKQYDAQYRTEERLWNVFVLFSLLAILVGCIGLYGLASLVIHQRTKEIAIRKIVGASTFLIIAKLSTDFLRLIVFAFVIALPVAWLSVEEWLSRFANRTDMPLWLFVLSGFCVMTLALITIGSHAVRAAQRNPIDAIRLA